MAQTIKLKRSATTGNVPTTSQLALGELGINTTDGKLFLKKSVSGTESIVEVGSTGSFLPLSGGTLTGTLQGTRVGLGDTPHATAALRISTTNQHIRLNNGSELGIIELDSDGELNIWAHGDGEVINLRTGSGSGSDIVKIDNTGIDVTGSVVADGLTVDGGADASTSYTRFTEHSSGYGFNGAYVSYKGSSNELIFGRHNTFDSNTANDIPVISFARSTGDISFYNGSGNQGLFFDSSASSLGIGTTSPSSFVESSRFVVGSGTSGINEMMFLYSGTNAFGAIGFADGTSGTSAYKGTIGYHHDTDEMFFSTNGGGEASRDLTISSSGNATFTGSVTAPTIKSTSYYEGTSYRIYNSTLSNYGRLTADSLGSVIMHTGAGEGARLTPTGLGIGTTVPSRKLDVNGGAIVRGFLTLYGTGTNNALFLNNTSYEWAAYTNASNNFVIADWNAAQTRLTLDTSGNATFSGAVSSTGATTVNTDSINIGFTAPNGEIKVKNSSGSPAANLDFYTTNTSGTTSLVQRITHDGLSQFDNYGGTTGKGRIQFGNSGQQFIEGLDTGNGGSGSYLKFGYGSTDALTIASSGAATFNSTVTSTGLEVNGTRYFDGDYNVTYYRKANHTTLGYQLHRDNGKSYYEWNNGGTHSHDFQFVSNNSPVLNLSTNGNAIIPNGSLMVGSTTAPSFTTGSGIEIKKNGAATLRLHDEGSGGKVFEISSNDNEGYVLNGQGSGMPMILKTVGTTALTLDTSQNATFSGNVTMQHDDALLFIKETDGTNIAAIGDLTGAGQGGAFYYNHGGTATIQLKSYEASTIGHGLNVGGSVTSSGTFLKTGTNGNYTIAANGNDFYYGRNGTNYHIANTANGAFQFLTGSSSAEALRITSAQNINIANGKLGIGFTTAPSAKLQVQGSDSSDVAVFHGTTGGNARGLKISLSGEGATNQVVNLDSMQDFGILAFKTAGTERGRFNSSGLSVTGSVTVSKGGSTAAHGDTDLLVRHNSATSTTAQAQILAGNAGYSNLYFSDTDSYNVGGFIYNHASNYLATNVNGSEKMRINNTGVGIGCTPSATLDVENSSGATFFMDDTNGRSLRFRTANSGSQNANISSYSGLHLGGSDNASHLLISNTGKAFFKGAAQTGYALFDDGSNGGIHIKADTSSVTTEYITTGFGAFEEARFVASNFVFKNSGSSTRASIDTSGNFLVGKTASGLANSGFEVGQSGQINVTQSGAVVARFNRKTSDGSILELTKDGSTVGSIGTNGGDLYIGTGDTTLKFEDGSNRIVPRGTDGAQRDAAISLGSAGNRFKDLYLSGTANTAHVNVGGGTVADPTVTIDSASGGDPTLVFDTGATNRSAIIRFKDQGTTSGFINYHHQYDRMDFGSGSSTGIGMSLKGGNLLVGQTTNAETGTGIGLVPDGTSHMYSANTDALMLGRGGSDGEILSFNRSGATIGSIGVSGANNLFISGQVADHAGLTFATQSVLPTTQGVINNNTVDLGQNGNAYKDLYLSGGLRGDTTFKNNAGTTEYARFSGGTLLVGTTGGSTYSSTVNEGVEIAPDFIGVARNQNTVMHLNRQGNDGTIVDFRTYGFVRGSVSISGSTTSYNTSSDERLKENIKDSDDSGSKVDAMQVRQFDWKADGEHQDYGMVAQELLEVAPDAVTQGDTPDDMMGVDYSKLVPMLIKEIQSLRQRVAQLEE